jgi:preprotein translocase subunit YajC
MAHLQPGDEVLLTSGFIGTIVDMQVDEGDTAVMTIDLGGVRVRALPSAVVQRWGKSLAETEVPADGEQQPEGSST